MLFTVKNIFVNSELMKFNIISENGYLGIINTENNSLILPIQYDNIFAYGENVFVVHKKGKIGAIKTDSDTFFFIAQCEYDTLDTFGHDLIFCNNESVRYYNSTTKTVRDFIDVIVDSPFLYCKDKTHQYILYGELGKEIYKKEYTSYSESCFVYCGKTEKGPVFYDARYSTYLYPTEDGYTAYEGLFNNPIIVNGQNVLNVTEGENGIGVIDCFGNSIMDHKYDSVQVKLTVTATNQTETETKTISFHKNTFQKGVVYDFDEWT